MMASNILHGKQVFSSIDLKKGYHQIPIRKEDRKCTATITPFGGTFQYRMMPMGLSNASATFQRMMDIILRDVPNTYVYLDDILVATVTEEEHDETLRLVFEKLRENGLAVSHEKCLLGVQELIFLGYKVNAEGVTASEEKVKALRKFPTPDGPKAAARFMGMMQYHCRMIPDFQTIAIPIYEASRCKTKKDFVWSEECQVSFEKLKNRLADAVMLVHPRKDAALRITTDASNVGIGAVLEQQHETLGHVWEPMAFYSRAFNARERNWAPFDMELCAIHDAVKKFAVDTNGCPKLTIYTDHKPIVKAIKKPGGGESQKQRRWLRDISEETSDIQHVDGKRNVVADTLSRPSTLCPEPSDEARLLIKQKIKEATERNKKTKEEIEHSFKLEDILLPCEEALEVCCLAPDRDAAEVLVMDFEQMADAQEACEWVKELRQKTDNSRIEVELPDSEKKLLVDISKGGRRPVVPLSMRQQVFEEVHGFSHFNSRHTASEAARHFWWPQIQKQVKAWAEACHRCQEVTTGRLTKSPLGDFPIPETAATHIHIDVVGPLPQSNGFTGWLTITDRHSSLVVTALLVNQTAQSVITAIQQHWYQDKGNPKYITADRGTNFLSDDFKSQAKQFWGARCRYAKAHNQSENGFVERVHRTLKSTILKRSDDGRYGDPRVTDWSVQLPHAVLALNAAPKEHLGDMSPAQIMLGIQPSLPYSLVCDEPEMDPETMSKQAREMHRLAKSARKVLETTANEKAGNRKPYIPKDLETCTHVYVRRGNKKGMERAWNGQYRVRGRSKQAIWIEYSDGTTEEIAIDRCKAARRLPDEQSDLTPEKRRKGRPKGSTNGKKEKVKFREQLETVLGEENPDKGRKGPGRPKGAKNKDKTEVVTSRVFVRRSERNIKKTLTEQDD